jgi:hypothetical protein
MRAKKNSKSAVRPLALPEAEEGSTINVSFRFPEVLDDRLEDHLRAEKKRTGKTQTKVDHVRLALSAYLDQAEEAEGDVAQCPVCESVVFNGRLTERLIPKAHEEAVRLLMGHLSSEKQDRRDVAVALVAFLKTL